MRHDDDGDVGGKNHCKYYSEETVEQIQFVYIISLVIWLLIICVFQLYRSDLVGWVILAIPPIIFLAGYSNSYYLCEDVERENFQSNYFGVGLLLILPLLTWVNTDYKGDRKKFTRVLVLAVIIVMLSLLDVWVRKDYLSVCKHVKSSLQTIALVLLIFAFYTYYIENPEGILIKYK